MNIEKIFSLVKEERLKNITLEKMFPWATAKEFALQTLEETHKKLANELDWWFYRNGWQIIKTQDTIIGGVLIKTEENFISYINEEYGMWTM